MFNSANTFDTTVAGRRVGRAGEIRRILAFLLSSLARATEGYSKAPAFSDHFTPSQVVRSEINPHTVTTKLSNGSRLQEPMTPI